MESLDEFGILDSEYKSDLELLDRYLAFSAELLRLSLLIITGLGLLLTSLLSSTKTLESKYPNFLLNPGVRWMATIAVGFLLGAAAFAVAHRYVATDAMSFHLCSIRLNRREELYGSPPGDPERKRKEVEGRNVRLKYSERLLIASSVTLCLGGALLLFLLIFVITL